MEQTIIYYIPANKGKRAVSDSEFRALVEAWKNETAFLSSLTKIQSNCYYLRIIALGRDVIPFILRDMQHELSPWFVALQTITGENPAQTCQPGNLEAMSVAWLEWGKDQGYL